MKWSQNLFLECRVQLLLEIELCAKKGFLKTKLLAELFSQFLNKGECSQ